MDRADAIRLLGLGPNPSTDAVKAAYRDAAKALHPDRPGAPSDATARMAAVNQAYALLTGEVPARGPGPAPWTATAPPPPAPARRPMADDVTLEPDGTLMVDAPAEETFHRLAEAVEQVGDITFLDRSSGLLQVIARHAPGPWCYLTFSLQGRASGTEIFTSIEPIDASPPPPIGPILERLADELRIAVW